MTLESLPTELRILILRALDKQSLHNVVLASPTYHHTYLLARRALLHDLVRCHYGLVDLAEPVAAIRSEGLYGDVSANKQKIISLLDRRRRHRELELSRKDPFAGAPVSIEESIKLLHMYYKLETIVQAYCRRAPCPPWMDQDTWKQQCLPLQLTETERARILRALCRLQTYYNIVGAREWVPENETGSQRFRKSSTWYRNFTTNEIWNLFFGTMAPWEVEEFGSVWMFARDQYQGMFDEIACEFPRSDPRWKALRPNSLPAEMMDLYPSEREDEPANYSYSDYCNHLVSLGPCFLYKALKQPTYKSRRNLLAQNAIASKSSFMDVVEVIKDPCPLLYPADKYEVPDIARVLPTMPAMQQPTHGWKQHWHRDGIVERVVFATRPRITVDEDTLEAWLGENDLERTIGYFDGWEWGYPILESTRFPVGYVMP